MRHINPGSQIAGPTRMNQGDTGGALGRYFGETTPLRLIVGGGSTIRCNFGMGDVHLSVGRRAAGGRFPHVGYQKGFRARAGCGGAVALEVVCLFSGGVFRGRGSYFRRVDQISQIPTRGAGFGNAAPLLTKARELAAYARLRRRRMEGRTRYRSLGDTGDRKRYA